MDLHDREEKKISLSKERYLHEDISWRGIGFKVLQMIYKPSFERNIVWEIRRQEDKYVLFESTISSHNPYLLMPGYDQLEINSEELRQFVEDLKGIRITIGVPVSNMFTLDGTSYEVCLYANQTAMRIQWHGEPHEDSKEIALITTKAIEKFKSLSKVNNQA